MVFLRRKLDCSNPHNTDSERERERERVVNPQVHPNPNPDNDTDTDPDCAYDMDHRRGRSATTLSTAITTPLRRAVQSVSLRTLSKSRSSRSRNNRTYGTNSLHRAIASENWGNAMNIASEKPYKARELNTVPGFFELKRSARILPLHQACVLHPPANVLKVVLEAYPEALAERETNYGRLPLHIACHADAGVGVVRALAEGWIEATAEEDVVGRVPLHYAVSNGASLDIIQILLGVHAVQMSKTSKSKTSRKLYGNDDDDMGHGVSAPKSLRNPASIADFNGWLALHVACRTGASVDVIGCLVKACPESTLRATHKGSTPLMLLDAVPLSEFRRKETEEILRKGKEMRVRSKLEGKVEGGGIDCCGSVSLVLERRSKRRIQNEKSVKMGAYNISDNDEMENEGEFSTSSLSSLEMSEFTERDDKRSLNDEKMLDNNDKNDNLEEIDDDVSYGREDKDEMNEDGLSYGASFRKEENNGNNLNEANTTPCTKNPQDRLKVQTAKAGEEILDDTDTVTPPSSTTFIATFPPSPILDTASKERMAEDGMEVNDMIVVSQDLDSHSSPCMHQKQSQLQESMSKSQRLTLGTGTWNVADDVNEDQHHQGNLLQSMMGQCEIGQGQAPQDRVSPIPPPPLEQIEDTFLHSHVDIHAQEVSTLFPEKIHLVEDHKTSSPRQKISFPSMSSSRMKPLAVPSISPQTKKITKHINKLVHNIKKKPLYTITKTLPTPKLPPPRQNPNPSKRPVRRGRTSSRSQDSKNTILSPIPKAKVHIIKEEDGTTPHTNHQKIPPDACATGVQPLPPPPEIPRRRRSPVRFIQRVMSKRTTNKSENGNNRQGDKLSLPSVSNPRPSISSTSATSTLTEQKEDIVTKTLSSPPTRGRERSPIRFMRKRASQIKRSVSRGGDSSSATNVRNHDNEGSRKVVRAMKDDGIIC